MLLNANQVIAGRYEIIEKLGVGGMAMVYMAKDLKLDRFVTFKVLKEEHLKDEYVFSKFSTEARSAASLSHHNIVSVYDVGVEEDVHYIVMEYIDGLTLKELIKARGIFEEDHAIGVAIQIGQALAHAHENEVVHQDIKPQNILITHGGVVKVTDFGIASANSATTSTVTTKAVGSVHYFSPEQAKGRYVDNRSDIYSLGIVMYEMMTGQIPFEGDNSVTIALKHINEVLPEITDSNPDISKSLNNIIRKATSKLSNQRYGTIEEMMDDLKQAMTDGEGSFVTTQGEEGSPTIMLNSEEQEMIRQGSGGFPREMAISSEPNGPKRRGGESKGFDIFQIETHAQEGGFKNLEKKIIFFGVGAAAVVILIISVLLFSELLGPGGGTGQENGQVEAPELVPDFVGQSLEQVQTFVQTHGLELTYELIYHGSIPEGFVAEQVTQAGLPIAGEIFVRVSQGLGEIEMPHFVSMSLGQAEDFFAGTPFTPVIQTSTHPTIQSGTVIHQIPMPGVLLTPDTQIILEVSTGAETVMIQLPELAGSTEAHAISTIQGLGLVLGSVSHVPHSTVPVGQVINMQGAAAGQVPEGSSVGLVISSGPAPESEAQDPETGAETEPSEGEDTFEEVDLDEIEVYTPELPQEPVINVTPATVSFSLPPDFANEDIVHLIVFDGGTNLEIFNGHVPTAEFPRDFIVWGTGETRIMFFVFNNLVGEETVFFN